MEKSIELDPDNPTDSAILRNISYGAEKTGMTPNEFFNHALKEFKKAYEKGEVKL